MPHFWRISIVVNAIIIIVAFLKKFHFLFLVNNLRDTYNLIRLNDLLVRIQSLLMQCGGRVNALDSKSDIDKETLVSLLWGMV